MRSSAWLIACACFSTIPACASPDRDAFPEDPTGTATSSVGSTGSSALQSSGSTSAASSSDGGGTANGGSGPVGPGGGEGGDGGGSSNGGAGPGAGGGADGGGGAGPVCDPVGSLCVPDAPDGWNGPFVLFEDELAGSVAQCNFTDYTTLIGDYFGDLDEGSATCECSCAAPTGITCSGSARVCNRGPGFQACTLACLDADVDYVMAPGGCYTPPTSAQIQLLPPIPSDAGSCLAVANHDLPTPTFALRARACGGAATTPEGCDAGAQCSPRAEDGTHCIVKPDEAECPAGAYSVPHVRHTGLDDSRACSACGCGSASSTCGGSVVFTNFGCGATTFVDEVSDCGNFHGPDQDVQPQNMEYNYAPTGSCPPSGGVLSGDVTTDGTVTFCCME